MSRTSRTIRTLRTSDLGGREAELRAMFEEAWSGGEFSDSDWQHATGGMHVVLEVDGSVVSHASVVDRALETGDRALRTGYVEAVATKPEHQRKGYASEVMQAVARFLDERYELGALATGKTGFYGRLGWEIWRGPTAVRTERGTIRTPEDDGVVMVHHTPTTPAGLDLDAGISCEWRPGDVW